MKSRFLFVFFLFTLKTIAQDHLNPVDSYFNLSVDENEYFASLKKYLYTNHIYSGTNYLVLPSFKPEYLLEIQAEKDKFFLVLNESNKNIWFSKNKKGVIKVKTVKKEISKGNFEIINALFKNAIKTVKFSSEETIGKDGIDYYFSINDWGIKAGKIWSPYSGTKMNNLIMVCEKIVQFTKQENYQTELPKELSIEIKTLANEIK